MNGLQIALGLATHEGGLRPDAWHHQLARARTMLERKGELEVEISTGENTALLVTRAMVRRAASGKLLAHTPTLLGASQADLSLPLDALVRKLQPVSAPFGFFVRDDSEDCLVAGTDPLGLYHVYTAAHGGIMYVSNSSTLIAQVIGGVLDEVAAAVYSVVGCYLGDRSGFHGVRKLPAGGRFVAGAGSAKREVIGGVVPRAVRRKGLFANLDEAVAAGSQMIQSLVEEAVTQAGNPTFEMSGGLDSRLLLAARLHQDGNRVPTVTIGEDDSDDVRIVDGLSQRYPIDPTFVPVDLSKRFSGEEILARVIRAAELRDFASNPLTGAVLEYVGSSHFSLAQVTGQGGELGRGFYYAGQPHRATFSKRMVASIIRWRLGVDQSASSAFLQDDFARSRDRLVQDAAWSYLSEMRDIGWPEATDQIYLFGRMQRWAGASYSRHDPDRVVVAPFFHRAYVEWSSRVPASLRRNSRAFIAVLESLSPDLVRVPLESGLTPLEFADPSVPGRTRRLGRDARRAARKARQMLSGRRHAPIGVTGPAELIVQAWRNHPPAGLAKISWLDQEELERLFSGARSADEVTIAFLTNLAGAADALTRSNTRGSSETF